MKLKIESLSRVFAIAGVMLGSFGALPAFADTTLPLFTATSDAFSNSLDVKISVDVNGAATSIVYTANGKEQSFGVEDLAQGIVLYQANGENVITLSSANFSSTLGGNINVRYLANAVSNSYGNFVFSIAPQGQNWGSSVTGSNGTQQLFTTMYLTAKRVLGQVVGIQSISVK